MKYNVSKPLQVTFNFYGSHTIIYMLLIQVKKMALNIRPGPIVILTYVKKYFQVVFRVNITFCIRDPFLWHYAKCLILSFYEDILMVLLCTKYKQKILNCAFMNGEHRLAPVAFKYP